MLEGLSVLHNCLLKCIIRKVNAVQVSPAVSNTVTEVLKQMTREEAVFFDLCSPPVRLVLYRPLDDSGLLPRYRLGYACSVFTVGPDELSDLHSHS